MRNIIWKLRRNDSGIIFNLCEINPGPFLDVKVNIWNIFHNIKSEPVCYSLTLYQFENFLKIFKLVPPKPESPHVLRLGMYASGLQGVPNLGIF